jgi:peptide/nickel transport system substrate-binding protein
VLRVGVPESTGGGPNVGIRELTDGQTLESLTQVGADGKAAPGLAEKWAWENDNRRLRLTLRSGVELHDGSQLDASRMAASLTRVVNRPGNQMLYPSFGDITSIHPEGKLDVVIDLSQASAFLPEDLVMNVGFEPGNVGSGPFRPVESGASDIVLERFDGYRLGPPKLERIVVKPFETLRTAWTSLLRDEVDMVTDIPPEAVDFIRNDDIQVFSFPRRYQYLIAFNSRRAPVNSPVVRRALNLAVDRQAIISNVLQSRGESATGPIWPHYWAYDKSIAPYAFDPGTAISLLEGAGFRLTAGPGGSAPARLRLTCLIPAGFSVWERVGLEIQKYLYNIGVDMQFQVVSFQEFDSRVREGRFDAALFDPISGPTPARAYIFWQSAKHHKGLNVFGYDNDEATRLFEVLRSDTNEGAIRSATRRLQAVFLDDPPALFIAWNQRARAVRREFQVNQEPDRDPMLTMWQWGSVGPTAVVSTQ